MLKLDFLYSSNKWGVHSLHTNYMWIVVLRNVRFFFITIVLMSYYWLFLYAKSPVQVVALQIYLDTLRTLSLLICYGILLQKVMQPSTLWHRMIFCWELMLHIYYCAFGILPFIVIASWGLIKDKLTRTEQEQSWAKHIIHEEIWLQFCMRMRSAAIFWQCKFLQPGIFTFLKIKTG